MRPELQYSGTIIGMGLDCIPEKSSARAENAGNNLEVRECCIARLEDEKGILCAQEISPEAWEAFLNVPLVWGAIMDLPLTQGVYQGKHAENLPERFSAPREISRFLFSTFCQCHRRRPGTFYCQKIPRRGEESPKLPDHSAERWWFARCAMPQIPKP